MLCPLLRQRGADHLLLGLRPADSATHPGQIAFPGGKLEGAEEPLETALRECQEEVGMPPADGLLRLPGIRNRLPFRPAAS